MFFAFLLVLIAVGAGWYIHKQFSPDAATPEVSIGGGSKREQLTASKCDVLPGVSNRSTYNTAATESLRSSIGGTATAETTGEKADSEEPKRDESSRDVKTARSPTPAEHASYANVAAAAAASGATDVNNNNNVGIQLVKDMEGGTDAPISKSPVAKTAIVPTESERFRGELGNLPDSTARNSSPNPAASNREVKADPATASALSEKKKVKKRSSNSAQKSPKKNKISKKSKEIKASDGGSD